MGLADIRLDDIIGIVRGRGPRFKAKVRVNIDHREPIRDGWTILVRPDVVNDVDVDLRVLADLPYGKVPIDGYGGRLDRVPGYAVVQDDDGQIYLILAIPLEESPTET